MALLWFTRACLKTPFRVLFDCKTRAIWATNSYIGNSLVHYSSSATCFTIFCSLCSALELEGVFWVCVEHEWNGLPGANRVLSSLSLLILLRSRHASADFCVALKWQEETQEHLCNNTTQSLSQQQEQIPKYTGGIVSIKFSFVRALLAPLRVAEKKNFCDRLCQKFFIYFHCS